RLSEGARLRNRKGSAQPGRPRRWIHVAVGAEPGAGHASVHGTRGDFWRAPHRRPGGSLFLGVRGLLGAHRATALSGEHTGANAPAPRANDAGTTLRGLRTSDSTRLGS